MRVLAALLLTACGAQGVKPAYHPGANPETVEGWGAVGIRDGQLVLGEGVLPYDLQTPLFTDYALKLRTVWTPRPLGGALPDDPARLPVGTVITKTFYYPEGEAGVARGDSVAVNADTGLDLSRYRLIETRVLVRREDGWHPVSYVWNEAETEARLTRVGAVVPLTLDDVSFAYVVPNENQCAGCHASNATTEEIRPLGPTPGQLAGSYPYADGAQVQLARWTAEGLMDGAADEAAGGIAWDDEAAPLDARARAYLAANCAHCHNPNGPADTSGLDLSLTAPPGPALGTCKLPIAAGSGTGGHRYDIEPGAADASILTYRMRSTDPGAMMPELGRALVHEEGTALVEAWIDAMDGDCG